MLVVLLVRLQQQLVHMHPGVHKYPTRMLCPQIVRTRHARLVEQAQTNLQREAALNDVRNQIAVIRSADSGSVAQFNVRRARVKEMIAPVAPDVLISTLQVLVVLRAACFYLPTCTHLYTILTYRLLHSRPRRKVSRWCASL